MAHATTGLGKGETFDFAWEGGRGVFSAHGTFDSQTVTLSALSADGSTYDSLGDDCELTENGWAAFVMGARQMRVSVSGSGSGADIDVLVMGTERPG